MDIDINKVISGLVTDFSKSIIKKTYEVGSKQYNKALAAFEICFTKYLERGFEKYSKIKTLLYRDKPVDLKSHYVSIDFGFGNLFDQQKRLKGNDIFKYFKKYSKNIVVGTAGSGKSIFLRRLFIDLVENNQGYIPILLELRLLISSKSESTIYNYLLREFKDSNDDFSEDQLHYSLRAGKLVLLLDGFDEISHDKRQEYESEILSLSNKYQKSIFVVSSRPDDCFGSWQEFYVFYTKPLNKNQAIDLISKINYDNEIKTRFIESLSKSFYDEHIEFLSNPLLLTIMLLTYEQFAGIPEKLHLFYEQAFDTLFYKHDALKSLYKRKSYCGIAIDEFKQILSTFCMITYSKRKISFTSNELNGFLKDTLKIENSDLRPDLFKKDLLKIVCILQKDGLNYTFTHRSFQEFFTALFISKSQTINVYSVLNKITFFWRDSVIKMLFDINNELVEKKWILPDLEQLLNITNGMDVFDNPIEYLSLFYHDISFNHIAEEEMEMGFGVIKDRIFKSDGFVRHFFKNIHEQYFKEEESDQDFSIFVEEFGERVYGKGISLSEISPKSDWIKKTTLPEYCKNRNNFHKAVYEHLQKKHRDKETELMDLIFN